MSLPAAEYRPCHPQDSDYYHCVEAYFEKLTGEYDEHFSRDYGFWRPDIEKVIYRYLDCGNRSHTALPALKAKTAAKIFLTHKMSPNILHPTKMKFLSIKSR